jgi:phosphatidylserine/phosphatidylglycerophosphate/cardiolipin synthase-like enzyme
MNELRLTRLVNLSRCIPRESIPDAHCVLRLDKPPEVVLSSIDELAKDDVAFAKIAEELRADSSTFTEALLALRAAVLTKARQSVLPPKAVCTLPDSHLPGIEETLTETLRLIDSAEHSISLMNYWMTGGSEQLLHALMAKMRSNPALRVVIVGDSRENFLKPLERMWNKSVPRPAVYIYKPGLGPESNERSKMHAKTLVIDEVKMLITSANMTRAAMRENIEVGISIEAPRAVSQIAQMINSLIHSADLFERIS